MALLDTQTFASPVVMEMRAEVEWFVQIRIRRKKLKTIAASNGVKKIGPREGRTIQIGNARLTWKASGEDTGYGTSLYEMDLAPGVGIPVHSHPYAEVFYVISGHTDFLRFDEHGKEEWVRCGPGDTLVAAVNALHAFHNRTDKPSRFISSSVYYHEVALDKYGLSVDVNDPLPPKGEPSEAEAEQYLEVLKDAMSVHMYFPQQNADSGLDVFRDIEKRNSSMAVNSR
jgi:quercetin dioxygenase-like cupin family protein